MTALISKKIVLRKRGFTLIEMMVTLSIFVIITGVVLFSQSNFNNTIVLTNLSYEIAQLIKQAQAYGASGRNSADDPLRYGVHLSTENQAQPWSKSRPANRVVALFVDNGSISNQFDERDEIMSRLIISRGNFINGIMITSASGFSSHPDSQDIFFTRPNPDPYYNSGDGSLSPLSVQINITSSDGLEARIRRIKISRYGLIEVETPAAPVELSPIIVL